MPNNGKHVCKGGIADIEKQETAEEEAKRLQAIDEVFDWLIDGQANFGDSWPSRSLFSERMNEAYAEILEMQRERQAEEKE